MFLSRFIKHLFGARSSNSKIVVALAVITIQIAPSISPAVSEQAGMTPSCVPLTIPEAAIQLNLTKVAWDICPSLTDISMRGDGVDTLLYNGVWWARAIPPASSYSASSSGTLMISLGGGLATEPRNLVPGRLPLLAGDRGFFVEFEMSLSDNDEDHWPAAWLLPIEHNGRQDDHYEADDKGYERYLEIDVDEGGFSPGPMGTAISWTGTWPNYKRIRSTPNLHNEKIDRTKLHRFGASFDPVKLTITFWFDGQLQYVASGASVPTIARRQHFYAIINANTHGKNVPFTMNLTRIRAFVPE